jgi:hypothetical protein
MKHQYKRRFWTLLFIAVLGFSASNLFAQKTDVKLTVKDTVVKKEDRAAKDIESLDNNYTVVTETKTETITLTVKVKSRSTAQRDVQLEWYFLSEKAGSGEVGFHHSGKKKISLAAGAVVLDEMIVSNPMVYKRVTSTNGDTEDKYSGDEYKGYVLLVTCAGEILAEGSNSSRFLQDRWIDKLIK